MVGRFYLASPFTGRSLIVSLVKIHSDLKVTHPTSCYIFKWVACSWEVSFTPYPTAEPWTGNLLNKSLPIKMAAPAKSEPPFLFSCYFSNYGRLKFLTMKTAIWARVTGLPGQKFVPPQPAVTPSVASCSIQFAAKPLAGTSLNIVPLAAGGV